MAAHPPVEPRPLPPREPESWECCQSGCDPCVYDHYWQALARYEQALAEWERRNAAVGSANTSHFDE